MGTRFISIALLFALLLGIPFHGAGFALASEGEEEEHQLNVGPGKAVLEADKQKGLRLSEKAIKVAGLKTMAVASTNPIEVPISAVVFFQDFTGVYRGRDGWFKLIEMDLIKQTGTRVSFVSKDFARGDQIVVSGAAYLRATDMDIWGPQSDSCVD